MNLDFDTIEIPEEKLNRTIQNNIKKYTVFIVNNDSPYRRIILCCCFFFCLSAIFYTLIHHLQQTFYTYLKDRKQTNLFRRPAHSRYASDQ